MHHAPDIPFETIAIVQRAKIYSRINEKTILENKRAINRVNLG
jgi:hypothetical protein